MNAKAIPCEEHIYEDLGFSLIKHRQFADTDGSLPQARVVILPDWQGGHTPYAARMAAMFGEALSAEVLIFNQYPEGVRPQSYLGDGDRRVARLLRDLDALRRNLRALRLRAEDLWASTATPLVMLGLCFGGTAAFEAARSDDDIDIAFSVHGTPMIDPSRMRRPGIGPAMHYIGGGDDGLVPSWTVSAFRAEIAQTDVEGSVHLLPGQGHSFTKKEIGSVGPLSRYSAPALFQTLDLTKTIVTAQFERAMPSITGDA